jgi:organic radical activating enzyme
MKPYCTLPFIQFANNVEGKYQACCIASLTDYTITKTKPMDFFNSEYMKNLRKDMLGDKITDTISGTCKKCIHNEKVSGRSKRIDNHKSTVSEDTIQKSLNREDITPTQIEYLKLKIYGNKCNLRCYMCSPISSSKVAADWKKHGEWNRPAIINPYQEVDPNFLYEGLDEVIPYLDMIELVGGEPLMFPELLDFMVWMIDRGYAKKLILRFITNGTIVDPEIFSYFKDFKKIEMVVSVDAYGAKDDYIRDGSDWNTKLQFIKYCMQTPNLKMSYSNTFTWMNIGHLPELYHFFFDEFGVKLALNNPVAFPQYFQAVHLPEDLKQFYLDTTYQSEFGNKQSLTQILNTPGDPELFSEGIKRVKQLDERRGNYFLEHFPEFEKYYNEA